MNKMTKFNKINILSTSNLRNGCTKTIFIVLNNFKDEQQCYISLSKNKIIEISFYRVKENGEHTIIELREKIRRPVLYRRKMNFTYF